MAWAGGLMPSSFEMVGATSMISTGWSMTTPCDGAAHEQEHVSAGWMEGIVVASIPNVMLLPPKW